MFSKGLYHIKDIFEKDVDNIHKTNLDMDQTHHDIFTLALTND